MPTSKKSDRSAETPEETVTAIKGFEPGLVCRGFQFREGETFKHVGAVVACKGGFHAIEGHPLEVFDYYAPSSSVFHEVELRGPLARHSGDSKIAAAEITIKGEIKIPELVARAIRWVVDRAKPEEGGHATGTRGAASATGYQGAASATGYQGAASATGYQGAASATGTRGAAMAPGKDGKVSGADGVVLFAVERGDWDGKGYPAISTASGIVGIDGVQPDVWYRAKGGKLVQVDPS